jgi:hypothetical protein
MNINNMTNDQIIAELLKPIDVELKVSMDNDEKTAGNYHEVKYRLTFTKEDLFQMKVDAERTDRINNVQAPIRSKWGTFIEQGVPSERKYGERLYSNVKKAKVIVRQPTMDEQKEFFTKAWAVMTPEEKNNFMANNEWPEDINDRVK